MRLEYGKLKFRYQITVGGELVVVYTSLKWKEGRRSAVKIVEALARVGLYGRDR